MAEIDLHHEFPHPDDLVYLNHAGIGPWPRRTAAAVEAFAREMCAGPTRYAHWEETEATLHEQLRRLLGAASADDIALVKNTSEALSLVAYGLDFQSGDEIVVPDEEFPSNRVVWESLIPLGVRVRLVDLRAEASPEAALTAATGPRTRLMSVSSVQYASGLRLDLEALGRFCRDRRILYCVDAIQSLGVVPMDVRRIHADFVMGEARKWLLSPEGLGIFYCRPELRGRLRLRQFGWHMVATLGDYERRDWEPAAGARRFECGSPNRLGIHGLSATLSLMEELGADTIYRSVMNNARYLIDYIESNPALELVTPAEEGRHAGIVTFRHRDVETAALYRELTRGKVMCAVRGGGIRFSPHFYTPEGKLERAVKAVEEAAGLLLRPG